MRMRKRDMESEPSRPGVLLSDSSRQSSNNNGKSKIKKINKNVPLFLMVLLCSRQDRKYCCFVFSPNTALGA